MGSWFERPNVTTQRQRNSSSMTGEEYTHQQFRAAQMSSSSTSTLAKTGNSISYLKSSSPRTLVIDS